MERRSINALPEGLLEESGPDRLHLGGTTPKPGWQIFNAVEADYVDHLGDVRDLSRFSDASFDMVYASHVLEHLGYQEDLPKTLRAVRRILRPGGRLFASVPDLMTLARLFTDKAATPETRIEAMRMMFGGQLDPYDFHYVGLWDEYLGWLLMKAGFQRVYRVGSFGLFPDTSDAVLGDTPISLNMVAVK
ncbi:MAG: methyltransferase domain-containing protein [Polyangiaceae bacterium]|nr:methyltransferase domain-containing protein [Polyangiaceae bacterium]